MIQQNPPLPDKLFHVARWDGIMSHHVKHNAEDDGIDRQSHCYKTDENGIVYLDREKYKERKARYRAQKEEHSDLVLNGVLSNEVSFIEYFEKNKYTGGPIKVLYTQLPIFLDSVVMGYCGRKVGKTWAIDWTGPHRAVNFPGSSLMVWSYDDAHVRPRAAGFFKLIDDNPFLRNLLPPGVTHRSRKPPAWFQIFDNNFQWHAVYPGLEGKNLERYHVEGSLTDEAQDVNAQYMSKWLPTQNSFSPEKGSVRKFFGVNTQGRTDTPFYQMTFAKDSIYRHHVYIIPSWNNPFEYTLEKHIEYLQEYGGSVNTPQFKQMIRGKLGDRTEGVFLARHYDNCCEIRDKLSHQVFSDEDSVRLPYRYKEMTERYIDMYHMNFHAIFQKPLNIPEWSDIRLAMDFGYGGGYSVIEIWFNIRNIWHLAETIQLVRVPRPKQAALVHFLMNREGSGLYPEISYAAIDVTGNMNIYDDLVVDTNSIYHNPINKYKERVIPVDFTRLMVVSKVLDKPMDHIKAKRGRLRDGSSCWEIEEETKDFTMRMIADRMAKSGYSLPEENVERKTEFMGVQVDHRGRFFSTRRDWDHTVSSNLCLEYSIHTKNTVKNIDEKLIGSMFALEEPSYGQVSYISFL